MRNPGQASSEPSVVRPICTIRTQSIPAIASQKLIHQMSRKVCRAPILRWLCAAVAATNSPNGKTPQTAINPASSSQFATIAHHGNCSSTSNVDSVLGARPVPALKVNTCLCSVRPRLKARARRGCSSLATFQPGR